MEICIFIDPKQIVTGVPESKLLFNVLITHASSRFKSHSKGIGEAGNRNCVPWSGS